MPNRFRRHLSQGAEGGLRLRRRPSELFTATFLGSEAIKSKLVRFSHTMFAYPAISTERTFAKAGCGLRLRRRPS